jgi:formyltetrahydrofolate deformylase
MKSWILKVDCADSLSLMHDITGVLFRAGAKIERRREYVDPDRKHLYMRAVVSGDFEMAAVVEALRQVAPDANISLSEFKKRRLVVFASKEPHCLGDLLIQDAFDGFPAEIAGVISNHDLLRELVCKFDLPFHLVSYDQHSRIECEEEIVRIVESYSPDYLVFAKFMRIVSPEFVKRFHNRIINIHHSFLPAFIGADPYAQAASRGVKIIGATAHFVTDDLDQGPIIDQGICRVDHTMSVEEMIQAGRNIEKSVLSTALKLVLQGRVFVIGNKTVIL